MRQKNILFVKNVSTVITFMIVILLGAQNKNTIQSSLSDDSLLQQYIQLRGGNGIVFTSSNIKQFWVEKSVVSSEKIFNILMNENQESDLLKIQLANVRENQNCSIEVITSSSDLSFAVYNSKSNVISSKNETKNFVQDYIVSSVLPLENTDNYSFYIKFRTKKEISIPIKAIILSFSENKSSTFLASPGTLILSKENTTGGIRKDSALNQSNDQHESFVLSGTRYGAMAKNKIYVTTNTISCSVTVKNIGDCPTTIFVGYAPYTKDYQRIWNHNTPYKSNRVFSIVSSEDNSEKIIIDACPEWEKGCYLALNAREDLSDYPNNSFAEGTIQKVNTLSDNRSEIILDKKNQKGIPVGTKARIQSPASGSYLYTSIKVLQPGEEETFSSSIKKDDTFFEYSPEAFSKNTYYVIPILLSYSSDPNQENTVLISDFTISY